ncbi:carbohydrate sulfotransferase 12-like [Mercenaria mercenaria]|uniref:carbohydrate sulfotransferase 12-like n=1 Tax=Mercenaria mercenaria TaxID=6596 RepID=UPI00234F9BD1|nr:carbohydrate sulfotransferase 12-like [Mercenaria mercenaria]XP_045184363.2 carbohydrate sulfotransferase 12-like [Mercenaria mercenaria]
MNVMTYLNVKRSSVSLVCLLLLLILTFYIVSERKEMVYYAPGAEFKLSVKTNTTRTNKIPAVNQRIYVSSKIRTVQSRDYSKLSMTTQNYASTDLIPKNDMLELITKYKKKSKSGSENFSRNNRNRTSEQTQSYASKIQKSFSPNENYPPEQKERIDRIRRTCSDGDLLLDNGYFGHNSTRFYYSSKYNFSYCKVPKSGSTFWTQVFQILKYGDKVSDKVFSKKRSSVHGSMGTFLVKFSSYSRKTSLSILVSRDPFSRLYSAYIDKSYLLLNYETNFRIRLVRPTVHHRQCPVDVTFQEFLDFVILTARQNRTLNRHWAPIYSLCRPCDVNAYILVKQESFSKDTELALQAFGVENSTFNVIKSALQDHKVETTVPGIIETVYNRLQHSKLRACVDGRNIALRLWTSLKIQGYLKETSKFPSQMFKNELLYNNVAYVSQVILNSINRHKMTSLEMKNQRHKALADAYNEIKEETIEGIREVYKIDFEMFGYSTDSPVGTQRR